MIEHFKDCSCTDDSRIYAAGKSNGGGFTGLLACDPSLSTQIAAFTPVFGVFYVPDSDGQCTPYIAQTINIPCSPGCNPIPFMEFHGSADGTTAYSGGSHRSECLHTITHYIRERSKREGYGLTNKTTSLYGGKVHKYEYGGVQGKLGIGTHYLTDGLGHAWPSTKPNDDNSKGTYFNATPIIMGFFNKYTL
jgi:poly(3-hydroxybutyrate) depolymerase